MAFSAGDIEARLVLDRTDFNTALRQAKADADKFSSQKYTAKLGVDPAAFDSAIADAKAKLGDFAGQTYSAKLDADDGDLTAKTDDAKARLDEVGAKDETAHLDADTDDLTVKTDDAKAKLDEVGAKDEAPRVGLDAAVFDVKIDEANRKLDELGNRSVSPNVGAGGGLFSGGLTSPGAIGSIALGGGALLPALPGALAGATAAAGTLGAAFAGVGKALSAYQAQSNAATGATKSMASAQSSAANQIRTAQQAVSAAETQQAHDSVTSAESIKNAQQAVAQAQTQAAHDAITSAESIKNAQQGVAQATQQAAQSEISAEQQLASAQYAEQQAQQSLTQARQQAILTLQQLTNAAADASLNVQQDQLNLQQAQVTQQQVDANSKSTALQRAQAALAVKQAEQALKEAIQNRTNSAKAAQTADKQGVAGNPAVLAAQHALAQAHQAVQDAQRNLTQVEVQGAQAIAHAEQSLADAIRSASWQRISDAQNIGKAQQGLSDTTRNASWQQQADAKNVSNAQFGLRAAYAAAATAATGSSTTGQHAAQQLAKAMAALTPAGKQVVGMLEGMLGEWHKLQGIAQNAVLPGVVTFLQGVKSIMPEINTEVGKMGGLFSQAFSSIGQTLQSSGFQQELSQLFDEGNKFIQVIGPALGTVTSDFLQMGAQSGAAVSGLATGLAAILDGVGKLFTTLGQYAGAAGSILNTLGQAVGALGGPLGTVIGVLESALAPLLSGMLPTFKALVTGIGEAVKAAQPALVGIGQALGQWFQSIAPLVPQVASLVSAVISLAGSALTPLLPLMLKLMNPFNQLIGPLLPPLTRLITTLTPIIGLLADAVAGLVNLCLLPLQGAFSGVSRIMQPIAGAINTIGSAISRVTGPISGFLSSFGGLFSKLTGGAGDASRASSTLSGNVTSLGSNSVTAAGQIGNLNDAFQTMVGNFTSKQQSVMDTTTAIQSYGQDVATAGVSSSTAQQGFLDATNAIGQMASALQQAHTPLGTVYQDILNQITALQNKGPLNKSETADLQKLKTWADNLAYSTAQLNFAQKSVADTMESRFIPQLVAAGIQSSTAKTDVDHLTNSIFNTGKQSDATKAARQQLIADLTKTTGNAKTAKAMVDKYIGSLGQIPKKDATQILLSGKGEWSIKESNIYPTPSGNAPNPILHPRAAAGMMVTGGTPGRDSVLINAMPGEVVVPTRMVQAGAVDHLRGAIPGFGTGGYIGAGSGVGNFAQQQYKTEWSGMVTTMMKDMSRAANAAILSAKSAASSGGGPAPMPGGGNPAKNAALAQKMMPAWASGPQWAAWNALEMAEAGWNNYAENPSSHAYGIPQALPYTKMPKAAWPASAGGSSSPGSQISWMIGYIKCMDTATQILTRRGWLTYDQLEPGDETIGYNPETGASEWTPVTDVNVYEDAPLVRISNKTWSATCTPGHRWSVSEIHQIEGRRGNSHGGRVAGYSPSYRTDELVETQKLTAKHSIRVAAPATTGDGPAISEHEAELLGWIMGDGSVQWLKSRTPDSEHWRTARGCKSVRVSLCQSSGKPEHVRRIDELMAGLVVSRSTRPGRRPDGEMGSDVVNWHLSRPCSAELLKRSGYDHLNPVPFVLSLSPIQRTAFLRGVFGAEGHQQAPRLAFGKGPYPSQVTYSQADGPQQDAITLAVYLSGKRPAMHDWSKTSRAGLGSREGANIGEAKPFIGRAIKRENAGRARVWCPTTGLGTWTARQGRQVFLTGNSRYGTPAAAEAHELAYHWYDQGGWLNPGVTLAVNNTGKPERVLTAGQSGDAMHGTSSLERRLDRLIMLAERSPGLTAGGLSDALNGMGRGAMQRGTHSARR